MGVVDEGSIKSKERSISNAVGEFEILDGVCGEIVLQFVTLDGETYTRNMIGSIYQKFKA
ncbi:serine/threonine protein kinase [Bacillus cereus]|nr:serine/threonine protein kinase [Bacillus cereus]